jgi:nitrate/nitrite transport system ATP-binding protein
VSFLVLKNVTKAYGSAKGAVPILEDINLEVERGEFVAIVGYSGAGKTTLISLIAGLIQPDTGTITLNDLEITAPGPDRGIVFQNYSLLPWLNAFENVLLAVTQAFPNWSTAKKEQHTQKYLELVNLGAAKDKRPGELSGGMRQRVSLARALAMDPQILLLDEPLSALDALTRATLQDEISRIRQETNKTVVLITNDPDEGIYLADRIIPLTSGPRATLGPSFEIPIARPRDRKTINHDLRFRRVRRDVAEFLLQSRSTQHTSVTKKLVLPDIEPEDLSLPRTPGRRRIPIRRSEIKRETIEVE